MPIEIRDSDNGIGNIITIWGIVREKELFDILKKHLTQDKDKFKKYKYSISDYKATEEIDFSTQKIEDLAELCEAAAEVNPEAITATVANQDLIYGLSRMWEMLCDGSDWEIMVFRNREDAEAWIRKGVEERFGIDNLTFR